MIYSDKQQQYGELWLLVVTVEARDRVYANDAEVEAAAQAEREAMERQQLHLEEEAVKLRQRWYLIKYLIPRC